MWRRGSEAAAVAARLPWEDRADAHRPEGLNAPEGRCEASKKLRPARPLFLGAKHLTYQVWIGACVCVRSTSIKTGTWLTSCGPARKGQPAETGGGVPKRVARTKSLNMEAMRAGILVFHQRDRCKAQESNRCKPPRSAPVSTDHRATLIRTCCCVLLESKARTCN